MSTAASADRQMPVISIKKYLTMNLEADPGPMDAVRLLVDGIGQHAVAGDADSCARFRESIKEVSEALADRITQEDLLAHAESVLAGLESHNRRVAWFQRFQTAELQNMLKMLVSAVGTISTTSQTNVGILNHIGKQVAVASELDDVRTIRNKLARCLMDIQKEAARQQVESEETIRQLRRCLDQVQKDQIHKGTAGGSEVASADPLTGLPLRPEAEAALAEARGDGDRTCAAVIVLDRLDNLNIRFGRDAGDEILLAFSRTVRQRLNPEDRLFRWGGPALLALLPRETGLECVRAEMRQVMQDKLEHVIQTPSRRTAVPIAARWCILPMTAEPGAMERQIERFAEGSGNGE